MARILSHIKGHSRRFRSVGKNRRVPPFNVLSCLWFAILGLTFSPGFADAVSRKPLRKELLRNKPPLPSVQISAKSQNPVPPPGDNLDSLERREHIVQHARPGETLATMLNRFFLLPSEKQVWLQAIKRNAGLQRMPAGKEVHFYLLRDSAKDPRRSPAQLKALEVDYNDSSTLAWEKSANGILFQNREKPFDVDLKTVSGSVETTLVDNTSSAGVEPRLMSQLVDIFNWDIDVQKDIHKGDSFRILYEHRTRKGQDTRTALRIMAAEIISAGQKFTAIYFEKQKGQGNYYDLEGHSLGRSFLRFPLEFTSITSHLSAARFHPLLKVNLPHNGVDFAAQRGTPVRAVGDGVVTQAGWNGSYGKAIDIQHDGTFMTRYGHLEGFAEGIQNGSIVKKGQIIGFVGSTGRSTGPHLHFELYKDQRVIDPLSVDFPAEETIEPALQTVFDNKKETYLAELAALPNS
jgi:murein DD-endopeptidase MepM/ murein hydrolase activator NlpD